jgi:predicted metalloprotease
VHCGQEGDPTTMPHRQLLRSYPAVPVGLLLTLTLTGCATVLVDRPSASPSPQGGIRSEDVTIVGATDDPVDDLARDALADLQDYWADQFPAVFGQEFEPPRGGYFSVDPNDVDPGEYPQGVGCGAQPLEVEGNAFYCQAPDKPHSDSITYDRSFLAELADGYGEFIPALVMAHEFGHAIQARVGAPGTSIATETQADCLAGSWTAWVADGDAAHTRLREPELDELLRGYFLLRDPVGTSTAEQSAHGSYFDRVSAFQEGFDHGPEACRDNFGPDRVFTQGSFRDSDEALTGGNAEYPTLLRIVGSSLPTVWSQAFRDVFGEQFTAPSIEPFDGTAPPCAPDRDLDLVYCGDENLVGFDQTDLARPAYSEIGDFAVATAASVPYGLAVRDQLGLSTDDQDAARSALCLTGWYAAKVFNRQAGANVRISPGDIDESVQFLLTYGDDPEVLGAADVSGFQQVDLFRAGFVEGLGSCDVGA